MKFLSPWNERRMSKCYWHKRLGCIEGCAALILKNPSCFYRFLDILSGLRNSWRNSLGALGDILIAWPSYLAGSTQRYSELAFLHKILLAECKDQ
jgi:hypothetical protein